MRWFNPKKHSPKPKSGKKTFTGIIAAAILVGSPMTLNQEGVELQPYYDSVGVLTWCGGETEIGYKEKFTYGECVKLFNIRYGYYSKVTASYYNDLAKSVLTPQIHAAITDMSYNVGLGQVKKSSMIRHMNNGDPVKACNSILLYKYAGGHDCSVPNNKICSGVWKRRLLMNKLCLEGATLGST